MLLRHRVEFLALAMSVVVHAAMLLELDVKPASPGLADSGLYVTAQLSDIANSAPSVPPPGSQPDTVPDSPDIIASAHVSAPVPVTPVNDKQRQDALTPAQAKVNGSKSAAAGTADYVSTVLKRIDANKQYPYQAWRHRIEGNVDIDLLVNHDGSATVLAAIADAPVLVEAAIAAINRATPLPVPAESDTSVPKKISFTMEFFIRH
jgi:outer membrane biosynthesis protein TonB